MQTLPRPMSDDKYRANPVALQFAKRQLREDGEEPTPEELRAARVAALLEKADAVDQEPAVLHTFTYPSYIELQTLESLRRDTLADEAAQVLHCTALDQLPQGRRYDLECGAAYLMRRPEAAWRAAAQSHAELVMAVLFAEELPWLSEAAAKVLATKVVAIAATAYQGVLEGIVPVTPGQYLRIQAAKIASRVNR